MMFLDKHDHWAHHIIWYSMRMRICVLFIIQRTKKRVMNGWICKITRTRRRNKTENMKEIQRRTGNGNNLLSYTSRRADRHTSFN
ncbi:hypothetical protein K435DRAFT_502923 [Dendrothele bispora CBS 962.96]|uniref:Uncharacterized protein n=1 Tax=Dendrothele bispora (strain CBS 962.96) TaxID=1314807 RepID=A0A4S8MBF4_DENBC|nr:hypothetical protein K435DRAFT_502923 [Dendrothele bispora CBS 962.96]